MVLYGPNGKSSNRQDEEEDDDNNRDGDVALHHGCWYGIDIPRLGCNGVRKRSEQFDSICIGMDVLGCSDNDNKVRESKSSRIRS